MKKRLVYLLFVMLMFICARPLYAQNKKGGSSIDRIVAIANDHIILKSEVDSQVKQYIYQISQQENKNIHFQKKIWYTVLENMIQNFVLLDQAKIDSVTVPDAQIQQRVNARINQMEQQVGGEKALAQRLGKSMVQIRQQMQKQFKKNMLIQRYRLNKMDDVHITRPEVEDYFHKIPTDSLPTIPEKEALSQIVIVPTPKDSARQKAHQFAEQIRDSVTKYGKSFKKMARKYSDGPSSSKGGRIPMYPMDQLAPNYAAAAAALKPGEISKVVETSFGFHVIRLNKKQGDQIDTNNILIKIDKNSYNDQAALQKLNEIRDSVKTTDDKTFAQFARQESQDPNTAKQGGRILNPDTGARLLIIDQLDPALYRIALLLKDVGDISKPKPFTIGKANNTKKAFRIVRLDEHNPQHVANLKDDYAAIKNSALQQKKLNYMQNLLTKLEKDEYIEYKIPVPHEYAAQGSE